MISKSSIRGKFDDVKFVNGVPVFFGNKMKGVLKVRNVLNKRGYRSATALVGVGRLYGRTPVVMSIRDAKDFFDEYGFDRKFTRPDFEKLEKFFKSLNYDSIVTSIYTPFHKTKTFKTRSYAYWFYDATPVGTSVRVDFNKVKVNIGDLSRHVNSGQQTRPYAFLVVDKARFDPPKVFRFNEGTIDGKRVRIHVGLYEKFGEDFGFIREASAVYDMNPVERETFKALTRILSVKH